MKKLAVLKSTKDDRKIWVENFGEKIRLSDKIVVSKILEENLRKKIRLSGVQSYFDSYTSYKV